MGSAFIALVLLIEMRIVQEIQMPSPPLYTTVTGKIPTLFEKIASMGVPKTTVDSKWLAMIGFGGSNDKTLLGVLARLGFLDDLGMPTERWISFRDSNKRAQVMEEAMKQAYSELYEAYPEAHKQPDDDLVNFFKNQPSPDGTFGGLSEGTATKILQTFKGLGAIAGLRSEDDNKVRVLRTKQVTKKVITKNATPERTSSEAPAGNERGGGANPVSPQLVLNVNIQLAVPENMDENAYDRFFAALKKHLLS